MRIEEVLERSEESALKDALINSSINKHILGNIILVVVRELNMFSFVKDRKMYLGKLDQIDVLYNTDYNIIVAF
jgi:hypothetical protein